MPIIDFSKINASFNVGGIEPLSLLSFSIELQFNAPPKAVCVAVPQRFGTSQQVVSSVDAASFWSVLALTDSMIGKPNSSLTVESRDKNSNFSFSIKNWVLADVGMAANATAGTPAAATFTLYHPIVLLNKYPAYAGPVNSTPPLSEVGGSEYLEVVKNAINAYSKYVTAPAKEQPAYKHMMEGVGLIDKYVKCEGCNLSSLVGNMFAGIEDSDVALKGFKKYLLSVISSGVSNPTLFSFTVQALASDLSLGLYINPGDFGAEQMILKPRIPYTSDSVELNMEQFINVTSSSGAWMYPSGVSLNTSGVIKPEYNHPPAGSLGTVNPSFVSVSDKENGMQILSSKLPAWYESVLGYSFFGEYDNPTRIRSGAKLDLTKSSHVNSVKKLLTQDFLDVYRQARNIRLTTMFQTKDSSGNLIVPGKTGKLGHKNAGLLFLIGGVSHNLNFITNSAITSIYGNYVRGSSFSANVEGAEPSNLISNGFSANKNYLWG